MKKLLNNIILKVRNKIITQKNKYLRVYKESC